MSNLIKASKWCLLTDMVVETRPACEQSPDLERFYILTLRVLSQFVPLVVSPIIAETMSDREGGSGGAPPTDEDLSLPKATVAKMITGTRRVHYLKSSSPSLMLANRFTTERCNMCQRNAWSHYRMLRWCVLHYIADPSPNLLSVCHDSEFIHLISSEANEICDQESKKTIAPEHIISALKVRPCPCHYWTTI